MNEPKILIVDDDENLRISLKMILEEFEYSIDEAATGSAALELIKNNFYNIAFVDIRLPDISGVEVLEKSRQMKPDMSLVMLTGHASLDSTIKALNLGAYAYIQKPYEIEVINSIIKRILEKQALEKENKLLMVDLRKAVSELNRANLELKNKNDQLNELDKMKTQFLSSVSHELRTPLNSIIGFAEALTDGLCGEINENQKHYLANISNSGKHLLTLINDLLDLSKIKAGKIIVHWMNFNVVDTIKHSIETVRQLASKKNIVIIEDYCSELLEVCADSGMTRQVLINLLSNAIKFSEENSEIKVKLEIDKNNALISVTDKGIGISEEDQKNIFDEFRQVDKAEVREAGGTGLGLAISKRIAALLEGTLTVESKEKEGSVFYFSLKLVDKNNNIKLQHPSELLKTNTIDGRKKKILLVEDDQNTIELVKLTLDKEFIVEFSSYGRKAIEMARGFKPDLIILDLMLPDMDGWDILKELKADTETEAIPVIIMSVIDNTPLALSLGAIDYYVKPVNSYSLVHKIKTLIGADNNAPNILLVDDEPKMMELLETFLMKNNKFNIFKAIRGQAAIDILMHYKIDLIVLDLVMPEMSGFEFIKIIKSDERYKNIPIIVLSGKMLTAEEKQFLNKEVCFMLEKAGVTMKNIIDEINKHLCL